MQRLHHLIAIHPTYMSLVVSKRSSTKVTSVVRPARGVLPPNEEVTFALLRLNL